MSVTTEIVDVTPELARTWLKANTRNRNLRQADVEKYARDMRAGRWQFTGEAIKFSKTGVLLDGQHRLHAIVKAGVPVKTLVIWGIDDPAQHVMDTGAKRTPGDALSLNGVKSAPLCAAGARLAILWETGLLFRDRKQQQVTNSEIEEWLAANPGFHTSVARANAIRTRVDCPPSVLAAAHWRFSQIDAAATDEFFTGLATRAGLEDGSPILTLDRKLSDIRRRREETSQRDYLAYIVAAWNHWRKGRLVSNLRRSGGRWTAENFPTPI